MNTGLRYPTGKPDIELETLFDFSDHHGILRAAEQCNGSGECRNIVETGVWMCPSYMATKEESTTTRARANILREFLTHSPKNNPFDHPEIFEVMDLCLMCKACKSECPSNVDMAKLKGEFLQHWYDANGVSFRSWLIAKIASVNALGMVFPVGYNFMVKNRVTSSFIKSLLGFNQQRNLPEINGFTLTRWINNYLPGLNASLKKKKGSFYLFVDEFTNYQDVPTGISFLKLFHALGYEILTTNHTVSARTFLSKGLLRSARKIAIRNVKTFLPLITPEVPLVGIEPSAILGFRDEYPDLVGSGLRQESLKLSYNVMMVDEFFMRQVEADKVTPEMFTQLPAKIKLHGHCHQKALASLEPTVQMLSLPVNYTVKEIPSGCCGMAGAFGYEKEHYDVSMKVGELVLFPEIRKVSGEWIISAPGISCRQQILDGTRRKAYHPVEVIYNALKELN